MFVRGRGKIYNQIKILGNEIFNKFIASFYYQFCNNTFFKGGFMRKSNFKDEEKILVNAERYPCSLFSLLNFLLLKL